MAQLNQHILLHTENLSVGYKTGRIETIVLKNLQLSLKEGQLTCLLGPNGVGKSTLIRTLSAVQKPIEGTIFVKGKNIRHYNPDSLARTISMVLTEKIPGGNLNVYELVALGRYPYTGWTGNLSDEDVEKIRQSIALTSIEHLQEKRIQELSDGELQKAMIARALAQDGQLLFLDEPTAHLDVSNRVEIMNLLSRLARETGKSILISSHDLELAIQTADIFWLCAGDSTFFTGTPEDLILGGQIARTFEKENFTFDSLAGNFKLKRDFHNKINLAGSGLPYQWMRHALNRINFDIDTNAETKLVIKFEDEKPIYQLQDPQMNLIFETIGEVLDYLNKMRKNPETEGYTVKESN